MKYKTLNNNFVQWENGNIGHRSMLKIIVNPILRFIQFWTFKPYVIVSVGTVKHNCHEFHGYTVSRVKYGEAVNGETSCL